MEITANMSKSQIFSLAHQICTFKDAKKVGNSIFRFLTNTSYKNKFSKALKYIYKQLKKVAVSYDFELQAYGKAIFKATYKQFNYLCSFDNVTVEVSASQFQKRIEMLDASEAIQRALNGEKIRIF
jgi:hypothetical protein